MIHSKWFYGFLTVVCLTCGRAQEAPEAEKEELTLQEFADKINKSLRQSEAVITEERKAVQDALAKISADMEVQIKTIAGLQEKSKELERLIAKLTMENAILKKNSAKLTANLREEERNRKASDLTLAEIMKQVDGRDGAVSAGDSDSRPATNGREYTVKRGDVLSNIARAFNTTVAAIQRVNNLKSTVIRPGQVLIIPGK